ncbi:Filaggrin-2 [Pteropus alecto]|uniref:Filaggrin-2 n=1 Tax=Pteropus alecto TaxID=9402 RepID=L5JV13_PTEAL|nr:Filaggrin-2 [Pteropus alecto]
MSILLRSVVTVIDVFYKYTSQDGDCGTLSKVELKDLLEKEFRPILKNPDDPDTVEVIMHMLDRDHDRRLDFTEFLLMVFKLAMACNKVLSKEYCKASGSKQRKHGRGRQHREEEHGTEEDDEDTSGQKSGHRYSSGGGNMTRRDLRKGAVGLALATHGVVAKKVMVPALVSWKETDTSHMSAPQGNPERHVNRDLNLRVGEGRVVVACHVDWKPEGTNQTLLSRAGVEDKRLHLALEVQETMEDKARQVVPAIRRGVEGHDMPLVLVTLGHTANHRAVEANREEDQVSPHAVDNMGLRKVSLPLMVNKELVPVNSH